MKHLKTYEASQTKIKKGDYVICDPTKEPHILQHFLSQNIGKIVQCTTWEKKNGMFYRQHEQIPVKKGEKLYLIQFENIPKKLLVFFHPNNPDMKPELRGKCRYFYPNNIVRLATPEEIENQKIRIEINKYNL